MARRLGKRSPPNFSVAFNVRQPLLESKDFSEAMRRGNGCSGESLPWWTPPARAVAKRPATIRRCAWRRAKWNGWILRQAQQEGNSNSGTSVAFLEQLRRRHGGRLNVIWDNAPAHRGEAMRSYLKTPGLNLRLVNLPAYSPDFNADEAIWGRVRESLPS